MKQDLNTRQMRLLWVALSIGLALPLTALSASLTLATAPLANATTTTVLPNLLITFDSSGSMASNYLPDWANDNLCLKTDGTYSAACANQPPFQSSDFNGVYYNPAIRYSPPVNADGTGRASQTTWTSVKNDGYGIQSTSSTNLVTGYVDVEWCTDSGYTDCLRNDNYILPGVVNAKTYATSHNVTSTGSGLVATGAPGAPTTAARSWGPHYYTITPGEYCDSVKLTNCQATSTPIGAFTFPTKLRWCDSAAHATAISPPANSCQGLFSTGTYKYARLPSMFSSGGTAAQLAVPAVAATATFALSLTNCDSTHKAAIQSVTIGGTNILPSATSLRTSANNMASDVRGESATGGYTFSGSNNQIIITAPVSAGNTTATVTLARTSGSNSQCVISPMTASFSGYQAPVAAIPAVPATFYGSFARTDIVTGATYPRAGTRIDCVASSTSCSYSEEMTNFANWWTYYQTRMQTMKTALSIAFKPIDNRYRVGFIDLWGNNYLPIDKFDNGTGSVKANWYDKVFSMNPTSNTPLRTALARAGKIFAGQKPVGSADPMQYSCQQNFTLMTTDGYWNQDANSDVKNLSGGSFTNQDGGSTVRPMYEGPTASAASLADVAKYYYETDLRTSALNNCTGSLGLDVCANNVFVSSTDNNIQQHMTTFTLGLGVQGTLLYTSDYQTATTGDFHDLTKGNTTPVVNWPVPAADTETAVDDLWHAAVNGRGTYFGAKDPAQLSSGLNAALASIGSKLGAGAAAATSTLNPVAGDNFAYIASYTTVKWKGNLEASTIDLNTGVVSESATWCVENVVGGSCSAPGTVVADTSGSSTVYNCVTPGATASTCSGVLSGSTCTVELPVSCTGTMASKVGTSSDSRTIKMSDGNSTTPALVDFTYANLTATQKAYFGQTALSQLSQWSLLDSTQQATTAGDTVVNFLRGQNGFEDNTSNAVSNRLFRYREATMGDALESQPVYVGKPFFSYRDTGYSDFVTTQITARTNKRTVFLGANDGMLHAFNAVDGTERWAYVPSMVIPNMWKLADKNYATMHTNYVNGPPVVGDVFDGSAWRTILVAGLDGGGRGYYALDITDPTAPILLWEIGSDTSSTLTKWSDADLGYSFGSPVITKKTDGTWVVLLTSGYNNTSPGDGKGYLYVRNALSGAPLSKIGTGIGDTTTPSGLAKVTSWSDEPSQNNTSRFVYGGDLLGNVWRFDINGVIPTLKFATLTDGTTAQPITARPELGLIVNKRVVFIGTGKYLETSDLTTTQKQSIYAIKDDDVTSGLGNPRSSLVQQTLTGSSSTGTRTATANTVNFKTGLGWYVDLPDSSVDVPHSSERVHINPKLDAGTLFVASTVPSNTVCSPGGYGWLNYFNYETGSTSGGAQDNLVSQQYSAPIVGINIIYLPSGKRIVSAVTASHPRPDKPPEDVGGGGTAAGFSGTRVIWRELIL